MYLQRNFNKLYYVYAVVGSAISRWWEEGRGEWGGEGASCEWGGKYIELTTEIVVLKIVKCVPRYGEDSMFTANFSAKEFQTWCLDSPGPLPGFVNVISWEKTDKSIRWYFFRHLRQFLESIWLICDVFTLFANDS